MQPSARAKSIGWRVRPREQRNILLIGDAFASILALVGGLYFWGQKDAWLKFSLNFLQQRVEFWFYLLPLVWMVFLSNYMTPIAPGTCARLWQEFPLLRWPVSFSMH
jgi:hypothetical protein